MRFSKAFTALLFLFAFFVPQKAFCSSKPIEYYIEHDGEQNSKPKFTKGADERDALNPEPEQEQKSKFRKFREYDEEKQNKKAKTPKYKKSKKIKKYNFYRVQSKNKAPLTFEQYLEMVKEKKREDMTIPSPTYPKDPKIVDIPEPGLLVTKYNNPPGGKETEITHLMQNRFVISRAVLSPDKTKSVFIKVFSYPGSQQAASEMYYINIPPETPITDALKDFHSIEAERQPLIKAGTENLYSNEKRILCILDWSEDSTKIAVKEKIGALTQGPWKTQIWTYDFETQKAHELTALREGIRYFWRTEKNVDLIDYMWDIYPIGWDAVHKDRIIAYAYAFDKNKKAPNFLGTWSIDYKNQRTELMSLTDTDFEISINGYELKFIRE